MELKVKLEVFEGPLDLLLHLLDKNKVSIYDIPIVEITNQYLEYIREMQRQDLNIMTNFGNGGDTAEINQNGFFRKRKQKTRMKWIHVRN